MAEELVTPPQVEIPQGQPFFRFHHEFQGQKLPFQVFLTPPDPHATRMERTKLAVFDTSLCGAVSGDMEDTPEGRQFTVVRSDNFRDTDAYPQYRRLMRTMMRDIVSEGIITRWVSDQAAAMSTEAQHAYQDLVGQSLLPGARFSARLDEATDRYVLETKR